MQIDHHRNVRASQREDTLRRRVLSLDSFISQTEDRTLLAWLRSMKKRILSGPKCGSTSIDNRKRAYEKTKAKRTASMVLATNSRRFWTKEDDEKIMSMHLEDEEISRIIGRSINAIIIRRVRIRQLREMY